MGKCACLTLLLFVSHYHEHKNLEFKTTTYTPLIGNYYNLADPVLKVTLAVSNLQKSVSYWSGLLGMKIYETNEEKQRALLGYADNQVSHLEK